MNLVMFDYDGVIVDSLETVHACFAAACQETGYTDLSSQEDFIALFEGNFYEGLSRRGLTDQEINHILQIYEMKQTPLLDKLSLFAGIAAALADIALKNKVVIITSNLSQATREILKRNGITCCADVIGADQEKSKIKKILLAKARYPDLAGFYTGDTKGDMVEGKKVGVQTVGVLWGWHTREKLQAGGADYLVADPQEMVDLFASQSV